MVSTLSKPENHPNYKSDLKKASEKLGKALNEAHIRALVESLLQKNDSEMYVAFFLLLCLLILDRLDVYLCQLFMSIPHNSLCFFSLREHCFFDIFVAYNHRAQKEAKLQEKELIKELKRNKEEIEKEKKRMDHELQKEKWQSVGAIFLVLLIFFRA